jgi:hypothetical protein
VSDEWAEQRRRAVQAHAAAHAERRSAEAVRARALIAAFVREATERGPRPVPLRARGYGGRGTYRTGLHGWYLLPDRTVAVGTGGEYYVLTVPPSIRGRLAGVTVEPQEPRLIVGEGGRDGESMPLETLLAQILDG